MDSCIAMEQLRDNLIDCLNNSGLSVGAAFFVLRDVYHVMNETYQTTKQNELRNIQNNTNVQTEEVDLSTFEEIEEVTENEKQNND